MPDINEFLKTKSPKRGGSTKKSDWDMSSIVSAPMVTPTMPQRRPGRGDDAPTLLVDTTRTNAHEADTKLSQSEAKVEPNISQDSSKQMKQPEPKLSQSEAKVEPTHKIGDQPSSGDQLKVEPQLRPHHEPKLSQSEAKVEPNDSFSSLVGLQRDTMRYVFDSCRFRGSKCSGPIVIQNLAVSLKSTSAAVRKAIQRLEQKGSLRRAGYKDGRGGWTEYQLSDSTYGALLLDESRAKVESNLGQSRAKVEPELEPQLRPRLPSSSSYVLDKEFKTTTTSEPELSKDDTNKLSPEWKQVNCAPLAEYGFGESQLSQIVRDKLLTPEMVQDSIFAFAFDLRENGKAKELRGAPLNYFMGTLRKGLAYARPPNYETPQEAARRKRLEILQREESRRQAEEQQLLELEFSNWKRGGAAAEIVAQLPDYARRPGPVQDSSLKTHFVENVWPELQASQSDVDPSEREKIRATIEQVVTGAAQ